MNLIEPPVYSIKCKSIRGGSADDELTAGVNFVNIFPLSLNTEGISEDIDEPRYNRLIKLSLLSGMDDFLRIIFNSYSYIGPLREEPSRRYIYEDEVVEIGIKGENATYLYLTEQDRYIDDHFFYNAAQNAFVSKRRLSLGVAVQKWLAVMNIQGFRPEPLNEVIYLNMNSSLSDTTRVNVADVGFGVSQIFPIILEGLRMPTGNTLILEQPEIHLHPKLQMQMADYFIALALSNKKVIAETHSDHLMRRLIQRVAKDESGQLQDMIGIYFIRQTDHGAKVEEIAINKDKGIINWPENFSDPMFI
jgi:predicted ATPase